MKNVWLFIFCSLRLCLSFGRFLPSASTASTLLSAMDLTANPCEDFFRYACGNWNKKHIIPEDKSSISTFEVLADNLQVILKSAFGPAN
jgi:predicted metalloendopeptidase